MGQPTGSFEVSEELLRLGSKGSAVANLQNHLRMAGFYKNSIDGRFGADTEHAVRQFQFARKLGADGIVGPSTWTALNTLTAPASTVGNINSPKGFPFEMGRGVYSVGRVSNGDGVNLRAQPHLTGTFKKKLSFNTRVFVSRELSGDWYFVTLADGDSGFVYKKYINTNLPDPGAVLHKIKKNEGALAIVKQHYKGSTIRWGQDERYYANVLVEANRGPGLRGIYKPTEDAAWDTTQTREGYLIWIPSVEFARSLRGKVGSGSITYELWQDVKAAATHVGNAYLGKLAFSAGLIHGALESVWDLLTGLIDLLELAWKLVYSLLSGEIVSDLKGLWDLAASLNLKTLTEAGIQALAKRWNDPNLLRREHFRGWLIGYVIVEIVLAVASGGATIVKWAGKAGKLGKLLAKFPRFVKLAEKAKGITRPLAMQLNTRAGSKRGLSPARDLAKADPPKKTVALEKQPKAHTKQPGVPGVPKGWEKFARELDGSFKKRLQQFRGAADLKPTKGLAGSEGQLFLSEKWPGKTLKRWFKSRLSVMDESIKKLKEAMTAVEANSKLKADIKVVKISEQGPDWVIRDFDSSSMELSRAMSNSMTSAAYRRVVTELQRMKSVGQLPPVLEDLLKKLTRAKGPSNNIHWSPDINKLVVIDMM
ncbi:peptidoglycan-binding protein [Corallococcus sp. CA054B]|uniref:peptidoglycan-binding protein n=1 Tax=Corallococcus sp. CA054B TaxID=2316734 RepID=UPI000EA1F6A0|nr:peptidoglycan-binding protein [Corallococcus sp. CA054B]